MSYRYQARTKVTVYTDDQGQYAVQSVVPAETFTWHESSETGWVSIHWPSGHWSTSFKYPDRDAGIAHAEALCESYTQSAHLVPMRIGETP